MVDIKELMRTYVFINDPDVKEVTTKFGVALIALGAIAALTWGAVNYASQAGPAAVEEPTAATGDYEEKECMSADELTTWKQDHQSIVLSGDYDVETVDTTYVCVYY